MPCPSDAELAGFVDRELTDARRVEVETHLAACAQCRAAIDLLESAFASGESSGPRSLHPGMKLGRYELQRWIGAGAMGMVYQAHDPQLARSVAIKILSPRFESGQRSARARFLAEAQAMATLSHPNVIAVHDVGEADGFAFFAMELVEGTTLRAWMREDHTTAEILEVFVAAGRGLACAHERGLVHRDFKPDNVLVGDDGRVFVIDFGLARFSSRDLAMTLEAMSPDGDDWVATKTGAVVGTPAYMAPEQLDGRTAEPRSDQFAFCVALFEALVGERPFSGQTLAALRQSIEQHTPRWLGGGRVPRTVRRAIERGLSPSREARFESMEALVARIAPTGRRRWVAASIGTLVAVSWVGIYVAAQGYESSRCRDSAEALQGVWDDTLRAELTAALGAGETSQWMVEELDRYTTEWSGQRRQVCEATGGWRQAPPADARAQLMCLARARGKLRATVEVALETPKAAVERAAMLLAGLDSLQTCLDSPPVPEERTAEQTDAIEALREQVRRAEALLAADRRDEAYELTREVARQAQALGAPRLEAEAYLCQHSVLYQMSDYEAASELGTRIVTLALGAQDLSGASMAAAQQVCAAVGLDHLEAADAYVAMAEGLLEAGSRPRDPAALALCRGTLASARGDGAEAVQRFREAARHSEQQHGAAHPLTAYRWSLVAQQQRRLGQSAEAEAGLRSALEALENTLGPDHSLTTRVRDGLAASLLDSGRAAEALPHVEHVVDLWTRTEEGAAQPESLARLRLAVVYAGLGRFEDSVTQMERAVVLAEEGFGPTHPKTLGMKTSLAGRLATVERYDEAFALYGEAVPALAKNLGAQHPRVAQARLNEAAHRQIIGDFETSRPTLEKYAARCEGKDPLQPLLCGITARMLGRAVLETSGDVDEARRWAARVEPYWGQSAVNPVQRELLDELRTDIANAEDR